MSILERLERDMIKATKAREAERLGAIRFVIEVLARVAKRHNESIEQFREGGRDDLVQREERQLSVVQEYLPEQLDDAEIARMIDAVIEEVGATDPGGLGQVMKTIMPKVKGRADGKVVKDKVQARLAALVEE
jgi:uncharacterized protein YqeY